MLTGEVDDGNVIPKAFKSIMKKVAGKMAKGEFTNLMKTPAPSIMHHHRSYLEGAAADLSYASLYLTRAAEAKDPMERLKNIICLYVGGHHINVSQLQCRAPLNPILGETAQRVLPTGEKYYAEQISHHPPITNFQLYGANDEYCFSGSFEIKCWPTGLSSFAGSRTGSQIITFQDGGIISIADPTVEVSGLTYGDRIHNYVGVTRITDKINKMEVEVIYNPGKTKGLMKSFKNKFFGSSQPKELTDIIAISIYMISDQEGGSPQRVPLSSGGGSWLSHIEFDGVKYWDVE